MTLSAYCVRIRFRLGERVRIDTPETELALPLEDGKEIVLRPSPYGASIGKAEQLALFVQPYATEAEALEAGRRWRGMVEKAFARLNIGADFGDRAATGAATQYGLSALASQLGRRVLNDVHGVMVFECDPWPRFVRFEGKGVVGKPAARLLGVLRATVDGGIAMSEREQLAYDLYSASFSTESPDARFALLMMALETIIEPQSRDSAVIAHIDQLIAATEAADLPARERASIIGSLQWLPTESIGRAGRRIAAQLGDRVYMGEKPGEFFTSSYQLRGRLFHGAYPRPTRQDVDSRAAQLELFVRDLLSLELLSRFPEA